MKLETKGNMPGSSFGPKIYCANVSLNMNFDYPSKWTTFWQKGCNGYYHFETKTWNKDLLSKSWFSSSFSLYHLATFREKKKNAPVVPPLGKIS